MESSGQVGIHEPRKRDTSLPGMKVPTLGPSVNPMCLFTCVLYNEVVNRKVSLSSVYASQCQHEE